MVNQEPKSDRAKLYAIAARACADVRTVAKYLRGETVRGDVAERIAKAVQELKEAAP